MRGSLHPANMNKLLQRQPIALYYLKQSVMEYARNHTSIPHSRFSHQTHGFMTTRDRTSSLLADSTKDKDLSMEPLDFGSNVLRSFVFVSTLSTQYEEPLGISEFVGYAGVSGKQRLRKHRYCGRTMEECTSEEGANESLLLGSEMCEECALFREPQKRLYNAQTRHTSHT